MQAATQLTLPTHRVSDPQRSPDVSLLPRRTSLTINRRYHSYIWAPVTKFSYFCLIIAGLTRLYERPRTLQIVLCGGVWYQIKAVAITANTVAAVSKLYVSKDVIVPSHHING